MLRRIPRGNRPDRDGRDERFWSWFSRNEGRLREIDGPEAPVLEELQREIKRVDSGLTFQFGPTAEGGHDFVVSADGIRERFAAVERLVAAAPEIPGWKIIAFRPRIGVDFTVQFNGLELGPADLWFVAEPEDRQVGLTLCIRGLPPDEEGRAPYQNAAYIMLDSILGEYDVTTKIQWIEWQPLPPDPGALGLRPLAELPEVVDSMTASGPGRTDENHER